MLQKKTHFRLTYSIIKSNQGGLRLVELGRIKKDIDFIQTLLFFNVFYVQVLLEQDISC